MIIDHVLDDRKPKTSTAVLPLPTAIWSIETFSDAWDMLGRDPFTVILYLQMETVFVAEPVNSDMTSRRRVANGVKYQIGESAAQLLFAATYPQTRIGFNFYDMTAFTAQGDGILSDGI
jgi:hypothetical protein